MCEAGWEPHQRAAASLTSLCQSYILRYTHHCVWRQLDPPPPAQPKLFRPAELAVPGPLPPAATSQSPPHQFRRQLAAMREYFSETLVRPVYNELAAACRRFLCEHRLKYGEILVYLVLQDRHSTALEITGRHLVFRKWSLRERMCLQRCLAAGERLTRLLLPGRAEDKLLLIISVNCRLLEELDISTSYVTDRGLLALCGVRVEELNSRVEEERLDLEQEEELGRGARRKRGARRAAAVKAMETINEIKNGGDAGVGFLRKLAIGSSVSQEFMENFSLLTAKMKPYIDRRLGRDEAVQNWSPRPGALHQFTAKCGCPRLRRLNLARTNFPKRSLAPSGKTMVTLGLTRDAVLAALLMLPELRSLVWTDLGEILQLYELVLHETTVTPPLLNITGLMDNGLTLDKLEVASRLCPNLQQLDVSMFNFSFADLGPGGTERDQEAKEEWVRKSCDLIFSFSHLRDLEIQYLDDSRSFKSCIQSSGQNLTRICLNKMFSISIETLSAIKTSCPALEVLEVFSDKIFSTVEGHSVERAISRAGQARLVRLRSLKLGGMVPDGGVLLYLLAGCPSLRLLCYTPYESMAELVRLNDSFIEEIFRVNPLSDLVAFCFEKCFFTTATFFLLLNTLPNIKYIGNLTEWFGTDRRGRLAVKAFVKGNNLDIDLDSFNNDFNFDILNTE